MPRTKSSPELDELGDYVEQARAGNRDATARLIRLTQDRLFKFALFLCGNREMAQDICQETYVRALRSLKSLQEPSKFLSFLYTIARRRFIDSKSSARVDSEKGLALSEWTQVLAEPQSTTDIQRILEIQNALDQLAPEDRAILVLAHVEGMSSSEVAEVMGTSIDAARVRLFRTRQRFIKIFDGDL